MSQRRGVILIIVAGMAALMAVLCLTFLARMRADAAESVIVERMAQARLMLVAGCQYVQEASRLGWGRETAGWVDLRDGKLGPKPDATGADDASRFPIGHVARVPMHRLRRPPSALRPVAVINPIARDPASPRFGRPFAVLPSPWPAESTFTAFAAGDPTPVPDSTGRAWFRVCRTGPLRFVVSCGAGGTEGHRTWAEVPAADRDLLFQGDQAVFERELESELRLWYAIEWSGAIATDPGILAGASESSARQYSYVAKPGQPAVNVSIGPDDYKQMPTNATDQVGNDAQSVGFSRNLGGTIRWIQRLDGPPADGRW
jgi:hypothetical protein